MTAKAPAPADKSRGEAQQPLRHAGTVEDRSSQDKHGYGEQRVLAIPA